MATRSPALAACACATLGLAPFPAAAQTDLTVEVGGSRIGPALEVVGEDVDFLMAGLRGSHFTASGSGLFGSVLFGSQVGGTGDGSFLSGVLEGRLVGRVTSRLEAGLDARFLGFAAETPFPYHATAVEGGPFLRWVDTDVSLELAGVLGAGRSDIELWRVQDGPTRVFETELRRAGGTVELLLGPTPSRFGLSGGWHDTPEGDYRSIGARAVFSGFWGIAELRADRWTTPLDEEVVAGFTVIVPIGSSWDVRGFFGRTDPDPLTLAQPGTTSGGVMIGRSVLSSGSVAVDGWADRSGSATGDGSAAARSAVYEIVDEAGHASRVRFVVSAPEGASDVQLLGDFTLWEPVAMERDAGTWSVEIDVAPGVHHFGFLVDDEWYLPDDAPDVVPDEWGRQSATLVIEGAS